MFKYVKHLNYPINIKKKDLKMAKKAGVGTIVALEGTAGTKELKKWADYVFSDIISALSFFIS